MVRKPVAAATATSSGGVVSSTVRWAREICRPVILRLDYALDRAKGGRAMRMKNVLYLGVAAVPGPPVWGGPAGAPPPPHGATRGRGPPRPAHRRGVARGG